MSSGTDELTEGSVLEELREVLADTLELADDGRDLTATSGLFGSLPELDSLAVMEVVAGIERRFGITFDDDDITMDAFSTVGTLAELVDSKLAQP